MNIIKKLRQFKAWVTNPCTWGGHEGYVIKRANCKMWVGHTSKTAIKTDSEAVVCQCAHCKERWGYVSNGMIKQPVDPDYLLRQMAK